MTIHHGTLLILSRLICVFGLASVMHVAQATEEGGTDGTTSTDGNGAQDEQPEMIAFDETKVLIEINATDGDVGFHALLDADAWDLARLYDPNGNKLFEEHARNQLAEQGLTENFFESSEPLCQRDEQEPDTRVVTLAEFLDRFPAGEYTFNGGTIEEEMLLGGAQLTYNLPAAPEITSFDGYQVSWAPGTDLGACSDPALVRQGVIADPAMVELVGWEVVVEPADDEVVEPLRIFSAQLPPGIQTVSVPPQFIDSYFADGVTEFKVEVLAIEESGNQTASEEEFELEPPNGTVEEESEGE